MTLALVASGLGVALIPQSLLTHAPRRDVSVHRLRDIHPHREISIVHRKRPAPLVGELIELLRDAAATILPPVTGARHYD